MDALATVAERSYPKERLAGIEGALMGFCAAFGGRQDCYWVAEAGIPATGVDTDFDKLDEMARSYPPTWKFIHDDVFDYAARKLEEGITWDLVSLDPYSNLFQRVADAVALWCAVADKLVILGTGTATTVTPPPGWSEVDRVFRSSRFHGSYWTVLERDDRV